MKCRNEFECKGNCWLNVAGNYDAWEVVSSKCKGAKEDQELNDNVFNRVIHKLEIINKYDFTDEEKEILDMFL